MGKWTFLPSAPEWVLIFPSTDSLLENLWSLSKTREKKYKEHKRRKASLHVYHILIHSAGPQWSLLFLHVRPTFPNITKLNNCQVSRVIATGGTLALAKGIINDTHVYYIFTSISVLSPSQGY